MLASAVKVRNKVARRSLTVVGAGAAMSAVLLASGTAAFAKSDMSMKADHKTVKVGQSIQFSGQFDDDWATGVNGDNVCLWQYTSGVLVRQLAPCAPLRQRNGKPLPPDSFDGYFTITVKVTKAGSMTVVPVVKTSYDPAGSAYQYAQITVTATRAGY